MTSENRILGYLGLAERGGHAVSGAFSTEKAVKSGKARLVLIAGDASSNTKKEFQDLCSWYDVPYLIFSDRGTIGHALGRDERVLAAVTDEKLAAAVLKVQSEDAR